MAKAIEGDAILSGTIGQLEAERRWPAENVRRRSNPAYDFKGRAGVMILRRDADL